MSNTMKTILITLGAVALVIIVGLAIFFNWTETGVKAKNEWKHGLQTADDDTNYETLKKVEDTCRAMIASYKTDKLTYEQYKDSTDSTEKEWAAQAKMRANQTANTYNSYMRENEYVWAGAVPDDIDYDLPILE